jgi:hypothetical protein
VAEVALLWWGVAAGAFAALPLDAGALLPQAASKSSIAAMKHKNNAPGSDVRMV